jgi:branched-chain amino acid transport system substrate-binding protein
MTEESFAAGAIRRREFLVRAGSGGLMVFSSGTLLAACGGVKESGGSGSSAALRIGYVSPQSGPAAAFGETDGFIVDEVKRAVRNGVTIGDTKYSVQIVNKDSQSDPQRAAAVANDLISGEKVDLMLASSTPENNNPVADACEAAGVPCISTVEPWEAFYFARGATPEKPFTYTYHFSFGTQNFADAYISLWNGSVRTNKVVGVMWPNDSDGNAIRQALGPLLKKAGFKIVDPGPYENGTNDYSAQIARFKSAKAEIFNTFPLPPDFATFWRQAAQQGYQPKIAQIAKTGLFPSQVEALGKLGEGLATAVFWTPTFPYKSTLTGKSSQQLGDDWESQTNKQWTQDLGTTMALFDAGIAALKAAPDPKDKAGVAKAIGTLKVDTNVGPLDWTKGPVKNVVPGPVVGAQWVKGKGKFPLDVVVCENKGDPNVPVAGKLTAYA